MVALLGQRPVSLGGLQLLATDDAGVDWVVTDVKGWDSAAVRSEFTVRQADHGAWASRVYLGARPITIAGSLEAPEVASRDAAVERLLAAVSLTDTLLVVGESIPKQALVRRSSEPLVELRGPYCADYSLLVTAADPRRYSTTLQTQSTALPSVTGGLTLPITLPITISATTVAGSITLTNSGSVPTGPTLTLAGPVVTPTIVAALPGGATTQISYGDTLQTGDVLVIDSNARTVVLNGTASRRLYFSGTWPEIPAASTVTYSWSSPVYNSSALLTGSCRSAWL